MFFWEKVQMFFFMPKEEEKCLGLKFSWCMKWLTLERSPVLSPKRRIWTPPEEMMNTNRLWKKNVAWQDYNSGFSVFADWEALWLAWRLKAAPQWSECNTRWHNEWRHWLSEHKPEFMCSRCVDLTLDRFRRSRAVGMRSIRDGCMQVISTRKGKAAKSVWTCAESPTLTKTFLHCTNSEQWTLLAHADHIPTVSICL